MNWAVYLIGFIIISAVVEFISDRQSRRWQRAEFARIVRSTDATMRERTDDFALVTADFQPGFLTGKGRIEWESPHYEERAYSEVVIQRPSFRRQVFGL